MRIPRLQAISLAIVLGSSLLLIGPFSVANFFDGHDEHAQAKTLPLLINDRFSGKKLGGDALTEANSLIITEDFINPEEHCEFCTRIEYNPGTQGLAGFSYFDPNGIDLTGAKKVQFWAMGDDGGEKVKFKVAGKGLDKIKDKVPKLDSKNIFRSERFALNTEEVSLDKDWKKYEIDLNNVELSGITHPFAFEVSGKGKQVFYLKGAIYDEQPAKDPLAASSQETVEPLVAAIIANGTEGVAPASFEFEGNITGGSEPYDIIWEFGEETSSEKIATYMFGEGGTYNVTLQVTDGSDQIANDSVQVIVEEPELTSNEIVGQQANATDTNDNSTMPDSEVVQDIITDTKSIKLEANAGIDIIAYQGDSVVLSGGATDVNVTVDELEYEWTQTSGPQVKIEDATYRNPEVTVPEDVEQDSEIEIQFTASHGDVSASDSMTIFVEHVEEVGEAKEETLEPSEAIEAEWQDECSELPECMSDGLNSTIAASEDREDLNLFSFKNFEPSDAEIEYVIATVNARAEQTCYLLFVGGDENTDQVAEPPGAISISSDSFEEYSYVWRENPITNDPWTVESLNSFLAGYSYGSGESEIEVSEFFLVITYTEREVETDPLTNSTELSGNAPG